LTDKEISADLNMASDDDPRQMADTKAGPYFGINTYINPVL